MKIHSRTHCAVEGVLPPCQVNVKRRHDLGEIKAMSNLFRPRKCMGRRREQRGESEIRRLLRPSPQWRGEKFSERWGQRWKWWEGSAHPTLRALGRMSPWKHHRAGRAGAVLGKVTWSGRGRPGRWTLWGQVEKQLRLCSRGACHTDLIARVTELPARLKADCIRPCNASTQAEPTSGSFAREACWALTMLAKTRSWIWTAALFSYRWQEERQTSGVRGIVRERGRGQTARSPRARPLPLTWGYVLGTLSPYVQILT